MNCFLKGHFISAQQQWKKLYKIFGSKILGANIFFKFHTERSKESIYKLNLDSKGHFTKKMALGDKQRQPVLVEGKAVRPSQTLIFQWNENQ